MDSLCTALPHLVDIGLWRWSECDELPAFSRLPCLKRLTLNVLRVEYMESDGVLCGVPSSTSTIFFPSLEQLILVGMDELKGWWKVEGENDKASESASSSSDRVFPGRFIQFPKLSTLRIQGCRKLRMLPQCPNVEDLTLVETNERLSVLKMETTTSSSSSSESGSGLNKLKGLGTGNTEELMSLPHHCLLQLSSLTIQADDKLESTERLGQVLAALSSSLRSLTFYSCHNLRSIAKGLEHLTALEHLQFLDCRQLDVTGDEEEGMPWKALHTSLRHLALRQLPKLVGLPRGLQHLANLRSLLLFLNEDLEEVPEWIDRLSSLEYLSLYGCRKLRALPEGIRKLTSLDHLQVNGCEELTESCRGPNGREWPKIQHIPSIIL